MNLGNRELKKLAGVFLILTAVAELWLARAADKIEFSGSSSTAPSLIKPGRKTEELQDRFLAPEESKPASPLPVPTTAPRAVPSKATLEKMEAELDRKKNWLVPGAQDKDNSVDMIDAFGRKGGSAKGFDLDGDKKASVMERYMREGNTKGKKQGEARREGEGRRETANNRGDQRESELDEEDPAAKEFDPSRRDMNGLADFNLTGFLVRMQAGGQAELIKDADTVRSFQPVKNDFSAASGQRGERDREMSRERESARAAEFMQMIKPRSAGITFADPINSPDRTGRELNPVIPRNMDSTPRSLFPEGPAARIKDSAIFGVGVPSGISASVGPSEAKPMLAQPAPRITAPIIHEAPKKIGFN